MRAPWFPRVSLITRGSRYHLSVALTLVSVIPLLSLVYIAWSELWMEGVSSAWVPVLITGIASFLAFLGYLMIRRYPRNIVKLRGYLESIAAGELPERVELEDPEDDIGAVERYMNTLIDQLRARVKRLEEQLAASRKMQQTIKVQAEELVQAERQRVMIESVGAACHHIGQPATVLRVYLNFLRREVSTPESAEKIVQCEDAIDSIAEVLEKLRHLSSYRTVPYQTFTDSEPPTGSRILDIES